MPEITAAEPSPAEQKLDRQLLLSLVLPPLAAGISTVVGFTVAHWITITAHKRTGYLVSGSCFALCALAAWLAWDAQSKLSSPDETAPEGGRRLFMAKLALLLASFCAVVVLAGLLVPITLRPSD
jgi:heme A synthase